MLGIVSFQPIVVGLQNDSPPVVEDDFLPRHVLDAFAHGLATVHHTIRYDDVVFLGSLEQKPESVDCHDVVVVQGGVHGLALAVAKEEVLVDFPPDTEGSQNDSQLPQFFPPFSQRLHTQLLIEQ